MSEALAAPTDELETEVQTETEAPQEGASVASEGQPETGTDVPTEAAEAAPPALSQGEDGRWRRPDGTYASKDEIEAQHAIAGIAPTPEAPKAPVVEAQPWKFKADRQEHQIEGAVLKGDRLEIPVASLPKLQQLLAAGVAHQGSWPKERQTWGEKIRNAETARQAVEQKYNTLLSELDKVFADPNALAAFYENYHAQKPALMERARAAELEAQLKAYQSGQAPSSTPATMADPTQVLEAAREDMRVTLEDFFEQPEFASVFSDEDRQYLTQSIVEDVERYVKIATEDIPEHGIVKGDRVLLPEDEQRLVQRLKREAERVSKLRNAQQEQARKVAAAAKFNASRQPTVVTHPPPVAVPASKVPAITADKPEKFKTDEDWRRWAGIT